MQETAKINIDDHALVEKCRNGDSSAMETLILKYQARIFNVIFKICASYEDAAELTQDTFVKIIENLDRFQGKSSFYTWAFRIAVNLTLNHCSRHVRLAAASLDDLPNDGETAKVELRSVLTNPNAPDPAELTMKKELCELAQKALMKLEEAQRAVIVLRDIEGMDYAHIAEVLNIELGTVKSRISRARSNLREILEAFVQ